MTLILAVKALDGVVLAGDSQATTPAPVPTRTVTRKLDDLHGKVAFGCSGSAGLRQRVVQKLRDQIDADACELPIDELRPRIHAVVNSVQKEAVEEHVPVTDGPPALVSFLFAGVTGGHGWIYEIAVDGRDQVHEIAEAIGEARHYAMYGMVHNSHYQHRERPMKQIRMLAYRIVDTAIRTDASGSLGLGDIEVYEVTASGAIALTLDEKQAMRDALNAWREQERDLFAGLEAIEPASDEKRGVELG